MILDISKLLNHESMYELLKKNTTHRISLYSKKLRHYQKNFLKTYLAHGFAK
jgi:hypothetical protein